MSAGWGLEKGDPRKKDVEAAAPTTLGGRETGLGRSKGSNKSRLFSFYISTSIC
jgi:hypothetical protein